MASRYSGKPLAQKLGLKAGIAVAVVGAPWDYRKLLGHVPAGVIFRSQEASNLDFIHLFVQDRATLRQQLEALRSRIRPQGMIWVSWPKRASKVPTDIDENVIREEALAQGLVDVKVCAIDKTWSGLKLVIPVNDRR